MIGVIADQLEGIARQVRVLACSWRAARRFVPAKAGYPAVVPLAGIFERWEHLQPLLLHLNRIGFGVHVVPQLKRNFDRVDVLADVLIDDLDRHGLRDVALLAHSKGGITGKVALLRDARAERIRHLIAIATPFKGSRLVTLVTGARAASIADLGPSSRMTVKLSLHAEADHRITSIFATFDEMIAVRTQVALGRNIEAVRLGHHSVLSSREVHEHVALELARVYGLPPRLEPEHVPWYEVLSGRKRDIARDYGFAVGWQLRSLVPDPGRLRTWRRGESGRAPVVLLPGVLERWPFLRPMGDRLHRAGHPVYAVEMLGTNWRAAPEQVRHVLDVLDEHGLRDVVLVAHSKGGLIGKLAMLDQRATDRIVGMVTVATPFNGSPYARYFLDPVIREFSPRHPVIRGLGAELEINAKIVSIWPAFDQHIPTTSRLPGARANVEVPGTGHFRILSSGVVLDAVQEHVRGFELGGTASDGPLSGAVSAAERTAVDAERG
ncbi:esterase/lipase family protein [Pseudoclavibacter endophyticus]|uniref:esterase/lipase family protein n=1 Tax=Pseudoclavibacter endophyticus TaxID=1778590 RepID=UPI00166787D0|nr:hypothetical protein [Pseudoclavibacter endophyticus]